MKRMLALVVCLALGVGAGVAQKQRFSQSSRPDPLLYPLVVHVTGARVIKQPPPVNVTHGESSGTGQPIMVLHLDTVIDGKKVEMEAGASALLHAGQYQGRVIAEDEKKSGWFSRSYELLFSDGTRVVFTEVAESE